MKKLTLSIIVCLCIVSLVSCGFMPFLAKLTMGTEFKFDMAGAKAIAAGGTGARSLAPGARDSASRAITDSALVKVMENGTTLPLADFGNQNWTPDVAFISTGSTENGDAGSVYVCFTQAMSSMDGFVQFIRIYPDNHYDIIWPVAPLAYDFNKTGQVATWSWWGMDSDPLAKGPDGRLYFKVSRWGSMSTTDEIYAYDPRQGSSPAVRITPENSSFAISTFMVDSKDHLYIQSLPSGGMGDQAAFMRYYTKGTIAPNTIFYTSTGNTTWVRGYTTEPNGNYIIMNGNNIRGMNGIIKANVRSPTLVDYELLYPNANSQVGSWVYLVKGYSDSWTSPTAVIKLANPNYPYTFSWLEEVNTNSAFDEAKFKSRVARYFVSGASLTRDPATNSWFVPGNLNVKTLTDVVLLGTNTVLPNTVLAGTMSLGEIIQNYPESLLKTLYPSATLFKDWLASHPELSSINFDMVGAMTWASDGLYALYSNAWWGGGNTDQAKVIKLMDRFENPDLKMLDLNGGTGNPSMIKIVGDYIYFRHAILDGASQETGMHKLSRKNLTTGVETSLLPLGIPNIEITNYDVSTDNSLLYFVGFDSSTNKVFGGRVDIASGTWKQMDSATKLSKIRIID